jgi:thiamine thiazole synthase
MKIDEIKITKAIIDSYFKKLKNNLDVDVAIAGAGPSGLVCAYYLAKANKKVAVFERKLSVGGGMWGGGVMFNEIVVQEEAKKILDEFGILTKVYEKGYYLADAIETVCSLASAAIKAGAKIFNLLSVEDVMIRRGRVEGLVLNWSAVEIAKLHVDPITMRAKYVVEATGHPVEVANVLARKMNAKFRTKTGKIMGEQSMWADVAEDMTLKNSKEFYPGVYAAGMSANAIFGSPRMGPIFGGMLLSGKKVAADLIKRLK